MFDTIVTAPGSLGDANPMIAIARGLKARGCKVTVATAERYLPLVERAGLDTRMLVSEEDFDKVVGNPDIWHPRKGIKIILEALGTDQLTRHYKWLESVYVPGKTLLVSHELDFAGRTFRDAHPEVQLCTALPGPVMLRSLTQPPQLTSFNIEHKLPKPLLKAFYRLSDMIADRILCPTINQLRKSLGLPPVKRILNHWWASPDLNLGLFDEWFAPPKADWPANFICTGFPLADAGDLLPEAADQLVEQTLKPLQGQAPIVFAPGSAHAHARNFLAAGAEACRRLNRPGVLLSPAVDQFPSQLPPHVVTSKYLPFRELMKHACAIVHHGGIGTTSQTLAAGLPHVVCPMAFDQFDNGSIIARAGCGQVIPMSRVSASRLTAALDQVLSSPAVAQAAQQRRQQVLNHQATPDSLANLILNSHSGGRSRIPLQTTDKLQRD